MTGGIVDAWAQPVFGDALRQDPWVQRVFGRLLAHSKTAGVLERGLTPEEMVAAMDAAGIETALLSAWCAPGRWLITNDQIAEIADRFAGRFLGVAAVDLERPVQAVRELERAVLELGFKALRVIPWLWNRPPNDRLYYPLYVKCVELGVPFCTQVGHTGPLMPSETGRPIPYLDEVALTFPELAIVGGHIGYPWTDEMIALAWKHENVYIDTSAHLPRHYPPQLTHFIAGYGKAKVLFGTNFPQLPFERCVAQARELRLPEDARAAFLRENARRVYRLTSPSGRLEPSGNS